MKLLHNILIPLALSGFVACQDYDADHYNQVYSGVDSIYIEMTFDIADGDAFTRAAVPNGGEEGDGWEYGREYENQLHHFTVFVLGGGNGINAAANTQFVGSRYFTDEEVARVDSIREYNLQLKNYDVRKDVLTYTFSIPILSSREEIVPDPYRFIVVANDGDLTSYKTLGALRDALPEKSWTEATGGATTPTHFVMSNENDNYYASGTGVVENPYRLHVTIERLAARIDYDPTGAEKTDDGLRYSIYPPVNESDPSPVVPSGAPTRADGDTPLLAYLYVDRMAIINGCQKPSYYIKRVADDINGTNLVYLGDETPTPRGVATNYVIDPYSAQKTEANRTNAVLLDNLFGDSRITNAATLIASNAAKLPTVTDTKAPVILGYVNENTFDKAMAWSEYTTGVLIQCRYAPVANYYQSYSIQTQETSDGTIENEVLTPDTYVLGTTFYMVEPNTPDIDESQRLYFKNKADAEAYATNTARKHFCKVVEYTNGICYYMTYMRHSNKVEIIHNTMEFGIVRNNIYRLKLNPQTGPGTPTVDPRHPEELKARIYVRKWLAVEHPVIYV